MKKINELLMGDITNITRQKIL